MDLDIAEVVDIIRQGGKFLISSDGGKITGLEKVRKNQFLLTIEEFKELALTILELVIGWLMSM